MEHVSSTLINVCTSFEPIVPGHGFLGNEIFIRDEIDFVILSELLRKWKLFAFSPLTSSHQSSFGCQCILTCCVNMVVRVWSDLEKAKMMERLRKGRSSEGRRPTLEKMMTGILVMLMVIMIVFMMLMSRCKGEEPWWSMSNPRGASWGLEEDQCEED